MRVTRFSDVEPFEFPSLMIPRLIVEVSHRSQHGWIRGLRIRIQVSTPFSRGVNRARRRVQELHFVVISGEARGPASKPMHTDGPFATAAC